VRLNSRELLFGEATKTITRTLLLTILDVSDAGHVVTRIFSTPLHPLKEERHFALSEKIAIPKARS